MGTSAHDIGQMQAVSLRSEVAYVVCTNTNIRSARSVWGCGCGCGWGFLTCEVVEVDLYVRYVSVSMCYFVTAGDIIHNRVLFSLLSQTVAFPSSGTH